MRIPLVRGRDFTADDHADAPMVAIVNETLARRHWRDRDPIGEHLLWGGRRLRIVGVAGDVRVSGLDADVEPTVYCSVYQIESGATSSAVFVLRAAEGAGPRIAPAARAAIQAVDAGLPVFDVRPLHDIVGRSLASRRAVVTLLAAFAGVGLLLAIGGLYAVLSHAVARRTQELGVRVALGARPGDLVTMVVGEGLRLVVVGLVLGAAGTLALTGALSSFLFGVGRGDPVSFAAAAILLLLVSLVASYRVGRRAARVDPITALRVD
jgi:putative ABC transport system permease protein